jgi:hypothetical protein
MLASSSLVIPREILRLRAPTFAEKRERKGKSRRTSLRMTAKGQGANREIGVPRKGKNRRLEAGETRARRWMVDW